ncbi:MAG: hypothetical protein LBQ06_00315 [Frankiaceae bacterium]|jgi:hypothetical protein|nr:hypothetical protein [Frankiaceae bacterium]
MALYEFTITLDRDLADEGYDRLFEAGLDDSSPGGGNGRGYVAIAREAPSLLDALVSALADVRRADLTRLG